MASSTRFFNIAGPCRPEKHYMLPPERRLPAVRRLVEEEYFFVLHAARQTGKTTAMQVFAEHLRAEGVVALHASLETSRQTPALAEAEPRWLSAITDAARYALPEAERPPDPSEIDAPEGERLVRYLGQWCARLSPRSVVLFLDEVDTIEGPAMVSFLAQLRKGYSQRPHGFPASIALIGLRDLKDYLIAAKGGLPPNPGSPFNIKAESLTLKSFTPDDVRGLFGQHTAATGQPFTAEALDRTMWWTRGQPYLVNAFGYHLTRREPVPLDQAIDAADIDRAKEHLGLSRATHLDNLRHRLYEPRVAAVVRPVVLGEQRPDGASPDDEDYCLDLGLLVRGPQGLEPANPLYREVLLRELASPFQSQLPLPWWPWQTPQGGLDLAALVEAFFPWWRRHGDVLIGSTDAGWREAAAHLVFMGFLQRVVNGGGSIDREFASGRGRLDLLVTYGEDRFAIELKRVPPAHVSPETVREEGISQLSGYLDQLGLDEGWLLIFDQREGRSWEDRLWQEEVEVRGKRLHLRGG